MPLNFDGTDDRAVTAGITNLPTAYPLGACAVFRTLTNTQHDIFQAGHYESGNKKGYSLGFNTGGLGGLLFYNNDPDGFAASTTSVPTSKWVFVGWASAASDSHRFVCYDYEAMSVVFNEAISTVAGAIVASDTTMQIGCEEHATGTFTNFFSGTMVWLALFNVDLCTNANALLTMAHLGPRAIATPRLLYGFNEMTGTTIRELTGSGNHATMTNFPGSPWVSASLPGPWWERRAAEYSRFPVPITSPQDMVANVLPNQQTRWQWRSVAF